MPKHHNWTAESTEALAHKAAFDFIAQIERKLETSEVKQVELAEKLGISEGAVSKMLNNPQNLTLKTIAKYSQALGIKFAIVSYDDDDQDNEYGLVSSEIFATCWYRAGKPRDMWSLEIQSPASATKGTIDLSIITSLSAPSATFRNTPPWLIECILLPLLDSDKNMRVNRSTNEGGIGQILSRTMTSAMGMSCPK